MSGFSLATSSCVTSLPFSKSFIDPDSSASKRWRKLANSSSGCIVSSPITLRSAKHTGDFKTDPLPSALHRQERGCLVAGGGRPVDDRGAAFATEPAQVLDRTGPAHRFRRPRARPRAGAAPCVIETESTVLRSRATRIKSECGSHSDPRPPDSVAGLRGFEPANVISNHPVAGRLWKTCPLSRIWLLSRWRSSFFEREPIGSGILGPWCRNCVLLSKP
jgi:hypothetical protein